MPWIVSGLVESSGKTLDVDMVTKGGVSFEWHFNNQETLDAIAETDWDFVVLQNNSLGPIQSRKEMHKYGTALNDKVRERGAQTILYMTWARQHIPEMQEGITEAYLSLARKISARVAPVGIAWRNAFDADTDLTLHTSDKSHPNPMGSYLAACVFYSTFYNESPEGLTGNIVIDEGKTIDLTDDRAKFLQTIAWETVQKVAPGD
jgi:hypothetical protein